MQIGLVRQHHVLVPLYVKKVAERAHQKMRCVLYLQFSCNLAHPGTSNLVIPFKRALGGGVKANVVAVA